MENSVFALGAKNLCSSGHLGGFVEKFLANFELSFGPSQEPDLLNGARFETGDGGTDQLRSSLLEIAPGRTRSQQRKQDSAQPQVLIFDGASDFQSVSLVGARAIVLTVLDTS